MRSLYERRAKWAGWLVIGAALVGCESTIESTVPQGLMSLSEDDRTAAMGQGNCPVKGTPLGESGTPVAVTVKGQKIFVCSESCKSEVEKDPDKYIAIARQ